jgi:predicted RNA-binding Zn-ribbon protein involved in translation (DUF1610 family)
MRHRKIRFVTKVFGINTPVGVVKVGSLARLREADTYRACPKCGRKVRERDKETDVVEHSQLYTCPCGFKASWWGALRQVVRATGQVVEKVRLTDPKEIPDAPLYKIPAERFRAKVSATLEDNAVIPEDPTSAKNLQKLIIATTMLGYVIVTKFNDTYEQRVAALTLNPDETIVLKELIPDNLCELNEEVMKADKDAVTEEEVEEAKQFLTMLPEATDSVFKVEDHRTAGLEEKAVSTKVMELEAIIASKGRVEGMAA